VIIRRALYYWQFIAAFVLPAWLLVGHRVFGPDGWPTIVVLVVCPIIGIAMLVVAGITVARRSARTSRAVSWPDAGLLALWHASLIGAGFYGTASSLLMVLGVMVGLGAFWLAVWELVSEAGQRVRATFEDMERLATEGGRRVRPAGDPLIGDPLIGEPVIVVEERRDRFTGGPSSTQG